MMKVGDKIMHTITGDASYSRQAYEGTIIGVYPRFFRVQFDVNGKSLIECFPRAMTRAPKQEVKPF